MKKTITVLALVVISMSCNNSKTEYKKTPPDSIETAAIYIDGYGNIAGNKVIKITKDTSYFDTLNSETAKLRWKRDSIYFIPQIVPLTDSLGRQVLDSVGKPLSTTRYFPTPNENILQDFNKRFNKPKAK